MSSNVLKEGAANLQKSIETVGGVLSLTSDKLTFKAHKFNVQGGVTEIELSEISSIKKCFTKFLGFIPLLPNSFSVSTDDGIFKFVVYGREKWIEAIKCAKNV
jgi:hypothetical protein